MNERIRLLADQATSIVEMVGPQGYASSYANFDREKFAQLIVQECADWLDKQDESRCPYGVDLIEHFGVE